MKLFRELGSAVKDGLKAAGGVIESTWEMTAAGVGGTVRAGGHLLRGEVGKALETGVETAGEVASAGWEGTKHLVKGTVDVAYGSMMVTKAAHGDLGDAAGAVGRVVGGKTGERLARVLVLSGSGGGDADGGDAGEPA